MKAVFTFGRMNPPTIGHEKLVTKLQEIAKIKGATPFVYLSHTQDYDRNPLSYNVKIRAAKRAFGECVQRSDAIRIVDVYRELQEKGYDEITLVVGADRVTDFSKIIENVVSAGQRDPDAEGIEGISASKIRKYAAENNYDLFKLGMPSKLPERDRVAVFNEIRELHKYEETNEGSDMKQPREVPAHLKKLFKSKSFKERSAKIKSTTTDRTPKGYGPNESLDEATPLKKKGKVGADVMKTRTRTAKKEYKLDKLEKERIHARTGKLDTDTLKGFHNNNARGNRHIGMDSPSGVQHQAITKELKKRGELPSWMHEDTDMDEETLDEAKPLNIQQRLKRSRLMKRLAPRIARMRKIKMKRQAGKGNLEKRARKAAMSFIRKKYAGARGGNYSKLSPSEKIGVDKIIAGKRGSVQRIAKRLMPGVRKGEQKRLSSLRKRTNEEKSMHSEELSQADKINPRNRTKKLARKQMKMQAADNRKEARKDKYADYDDEDRKARGMKKFGEAYGSTRAKNDAKRAKSMEPAMRFHQKVTKTEDDESPVDHLEMQLRKSVSMRGQHTVNFADGGSHKVSMGTAYKAQKHIASHKRPADRQALVSKMTKSHAHFKKAIGEEITFDESFEAMLDEGKERKGGKWNYDDNSTAKANSYLANAGDFRKRRKEERKKAKAKAHKALKSGS